MSTPKKVLITGAKGNLGDKIRQHLDTAQENYELVLIDRHEQGDSAIIQADLSIYDEAWAQHFAGIDAVVHLAAEPNPSASWNSLVKLNLDLLMNVYEAAVAKGSKRLIFASSNHTMGGYREENVVLTPNTPPKPGNPYGTTKLMGERIGKSYSERHGLSVICLRIGWTPRGENRPDEAMDNNWWWQMWLSNRDYCQVVEKAILVENVPFAVLNAMSNNTGMKWDLSDTRRILGYEPQDNAYAQKK